jgi:hypothetical protein
MIEAKFVGSSLGASMVNWTIDVSYEGSTIDGSESHSFPSSKRY